MEAQRKRVLIVHADEYALISLEQSLENSGFSTTTAWSVPEAAGFLLSYPFDLIVVGNRPPALSATDLLAMASPWNAGTKFVVLQGGRSFMAACFDGISSDAAKCA
jgi:DNA-binding NtrC family response regulator